MFFLFFFPPGQAVIAQDIFGMPNNATLIDAAGHRAQFRTASGLNVGALSRRILSPQPGGRGCEKQMPTRRFDLK